MSTVNYKGRLTDIVEQRATYWLMGCFRAVVAPLLKNVDLSRLGNPCCPGFLTGNASPGQKRVPFCSGSGNRDKRGHFVPVGNTNRDKRCCQRPRGWRTLLSWLVGPFFSCFPFLNSFSISIILLHFN